MPAERRRLLRLALSVALPTLSAGAAALIALHAGTRSRHPLPATVSVSLPRDVTPPEQGAGPDGRRGSWPCLLLSIVLPALAAASVTAALVLPVQRVRVARSATPAVPATLVDRLAGSERPAPPSRVSIPAIGASGPVDPAATRHGELAIPPPGRAGWWRGGPRPGEPGRAIVVSHVDSTAGPALFFRLHELARGARILMRDRRGRVHRFAVTRRAEVPKSGFPADAVLRPTPAPELVLITCGGPFTSGHGYRDNVILYARAA